VAREIPHSRSTLDLDKVQDPERLKERLLKRLAKLGVKVTVEEPAPVG
jgi:hypothetical protein